MKSFKAKTEEEEKIVEFQERFYTWLTNSEMKIIFTNYVIHSYPRTIFSIVVVFC